MVTEFKRLRSLVILSGVLGVTGCSSLGALFSVDAVDDNVDYRSGGKSVKELAIPPGLSSPGFDNSFATVPALAKTSSDSTAGKQAMTQPPVAETKPKPKQVETPRVVDAKPTQADTPKQASASSGSSSGLPRVKMIRLKGGEPALAINASSAQTWGSLSGLLGKVGLQVQKQQQDQGILTTVYQGKNNSDRGLGSIVSSLLGGGTGDSDKNSVLKKGTTYLILLAEDPSGNSFIGVADKQGKPASEAVANEILNALKAEYER